MVFRSGHRAALAWGTSRRLINLINSSMRLAGVVRRVRNGKNQNPRRPDASLFHIEFSVSHSGEHGSQFQTDAVPSDLIGGHSDAIVSDGQAGLDRFDTLQRDAHRPPA